MEEIASRHLQKIEKRQLPHPDNAGKAVLLVVKSRGQSVKG